MLQRPVVGNSGIEGILAVDLARIMPNTGTVGHNRRFDTYPLETIPNQGRNRHQAIGVWAQKDFLHFAPGRARVPIIVKYELDVAEGYSIAEHHFGVDMPPLDRARVNGRKVNFTEPGKVQRIRPQHMHDLAPLVDNLAQGSDNYAVDQKCPPKYSDNCRPETAEALSPLTSTSRYQPAVAAKV